MVRTGWKLDQNWYYALCVVGNKAWVGFLGTECSVRAHRCPFRLELVNHELEIRDKKFVGDISHEDAVLSRLCALWEGTGRVVCADRYFDSVSRAEKPHQLDLKFIEWPRKLPKSFCWSIFRITSFRFSNKTLVRREKNGTIEMAGLLSN